MAMLSDSGTLGTLSKNLTDAVEQAGQAVVAIEARQRLPASGIHWRQGVIITADHVIKRDEEIIVTLPKEGTVAATLVGRDPGTNLAVLRLKGGELPLAEVGDTALLKVGHLVLALGRSDERSLNASLGIISALGGAWRTWYGGQIDQFVRPDLTLYPGCSGGPLVNIQGQVVGVNISGPRRMVLTLPTATVNRVVDQLLETGQISRGYLGLGMQPVRLPDKLINALKLSTNSGLIVVTVEPEGPAEQAGVLIGDVLIGLDGVPVNDMSDVQVMLTPDRIGQPVSTQVIRGGELTELAITVAERSLGGEYHEAGRYRSRRGFRGRR